MSLYSLLNALEIGFAIAPLCIGSFITFRILKYPDLTCEGSFALGGGVTSFLLVHECSPILTIFIVMILGSLSGILTGVISEKLKVPPIVASILSLTALYSINLGIMGQSLISLRGLNTIFSSFKMFLGYNVSSPEDPGNLLIYFGLLVLIVAFIIILLSWFFQTEFGLRLRATGANPSIAPSMGINVGLYTIIGLALANGLNSLSGLLIAQLQGFGDVNMGFGMLVLALAGVYIGQVIESRVFKTTKPILILIFILIGTTAYNLILQIALSVGISSTYFNLLNAIILLFVLLMPTVKESTERAIRRS